MGNLYMMTTIASRKDAPRYAEVFRDNNLNVMLVSMGYGTATNEVLDFLGLDSNEKAITFSVLEESSWLTVKKTDGKETTDRCSRWWNIFYCPT